MNAKQLYLAWLRSNHPDVYVSALRRVAGKPRSLGGLGQDITDSFTAPDVASAVSDIQISPDVVTSLNNLSSDGTAVAAPSSTAASNVFSSIANAVSSVANTYLTTSAQSNLITLNTQRAMQGLPPLTANGLPVTAAGLMPANATLAALEARLSGATGGAGGTLLLLGGLAVVGFLMFSGGKKPATA